jgi:hypothetical protein
MKEQATSRVNIDLILVQWRKEVEKMSIDEVDEKHPHV